LLQSIKRSIGPGENPWKNGFGSKRDDVMGDWRKLHNEELHNLYSLPNIIRIIKSRRLRWTRMGKKRNA
jgi:hypothetical protein